MLAKIQVLISVLGCGVFFAGQAVAQSNLDAGKSAAQIFADTCNACHRSPREIKKTSPAFMREHYTTGMREAVMMANYLASVGSDAQAVQQRKPPAMGAGHVPSVEPNSRATAQPNGTDPTRNSASLSEHPAGAGAENGRSSVTLAPTPSLLRPDSQAALSPNAPQATPANGLRPRRPSESVEIGANAWAPGFAPGQPSARGRATTPVNLEE
jgi:hypothetical protein